MSRRRAKIEVMDTLVRVGTSTKRIRVVLALMLCICTGMLAGSMSWAADPVINTVAGGWIGDGGPATSAGLAMPQGIAVDASGNIYIADARNNRVRKVDASGVITTLAGSGTTGYSGDGGPATSARLAMPQGVAVDASGTIHIADTGNNCIRKVNVSGIISMVAGNGTSGYSGDGMPATSASLYSPQGIALDAFGNIYIADTNNSRIRKVDAAGMITTVAGNGTRAYAGDGGPAISASLSGPSGVSVDASGNLYIADTGNNRIRMIDPSGIIITVAGNGTNAYSGDGGPAVSASLKSPQGVFVDASGNIYIADTGNDRVRLVITGIITTVAGNGTNAYSGDGGPAVSASLKSPQGVFVDASGNMYVVDALSCCVRKVDASGIIATVAGGLSGDGGPATSANLGSTRGVALDAFGNMYITEGFNSSIRKVDASGLITTVAGNGITGFSGDGGPATSAALNGPWSVAVDAARSIYIADSNNNRIRKVDATGVITTIAGNGIAGYSGDGGPAASAGLRTPQGVAVDSDGNIYIADSLNYRIRKIDASSGIITTVAGNGTTGFSGDGGPAVSASLFVPRGVAVDGSRNIFIADTGHSRIRKVDTSGIITTIAGNGMPGYSGDDGPAVSASLNNPWGITVDTAGNIYVTETGGSRVRKIDPSGIITTVAGNGVAGYSGDGGSATSASLNSPNGVAVDGLENIYIADTNNDRIRMVGVNRVTLTETVLDSAGNPVEGAVAQIVNGSSAVTDASGAFVLAVPQNIVFQYTISKTGYRTWYSNNRLVATSTIGPNRILYNDAEVAGWGVNPGFAAAYGRAADSATGQTINNPMVTAESTVTPGVFYSVVYDPVCGTGNGTCRFFIINIMPNDPVMVRVSAAGYQNGQFRLYSLPADGIGSVFIRLQETQGVTQPLTVTIAGNGSGFVEYSTGGGCQGDSCTEAFPGGGTVILTATAYSGSAFAGWSGSCSGTEPCTVLMDTARAVTAAFNTVPSSPGIITTVAGGWVGDGGPALLAGLGSPWTVTTDASGNVYIAELRWHRIRKVSTSGIITSVAGIGESGFSGDGGPAAHAKLNGPSGLAVDAVGNIYISDTSNNRVRKVETSGVITTIAGNGAAGYSGDGGPASAASLSSPRGLAVDGLGNVYIADSINRRVRKVDTSGTITTVAGNGTYGYSGDGGPATAASFGTVWDVAIDAAGNLTIADMNNHRIRRVDTSGIITTIAGNGIAAYSGDGGPAVSANLSSPRGVVIDRWGNLYIADGGNLRVRKIDTAGVITTVAGTGNSGYAGDGGPALAANLDSVFDVSIDNADNIFIANAMDQLIRKVDSAGIIDRFAGGWLGDGGSASEATVNRPQGAAVDGFGNLLIADSRNNRIRKVNMSGVITTVAGDGTAGYSGDGGSAVLASLNGPASVAIDGSGTIFIADTANHRIRKVDASGMITTVAGDGTAGYSGDGGPAVSASLNSPYAVALDSGGSLYIADLSNNRIRKVAPSGVISTVAGNGIAGSSGDNGPAVSASLNGPRGVAVDASGAVYIADSNNQRIRKVDTSGVITTIAGTGFRGYAGDGGPALSANLSNPAGVAIDKTGAIYLADDGNQRIRKVDASGMITTVAGNGTAGYSGDGGPATSASLSMNRAMDTGGITVDALGNVFIADTANSRVRMVGGAVSTVTLIETVADSAGNPLEGAVAQMVNGSSALSDASGAFVLAVPQNIAFRYTISKTGYRTWYSNTRTLATSDTGPRRTLYTDAEAAAWGVNPGFAALRGRAVDSSTGQTINNPAVSAESTMTPGLIYWVVYDSACGTGSGECYYSVINVAPNDAVLVAVSAPGYAASQVTASPVPADGIGSAYIRLSKAPRYRVTTNSPTIAAGNEHTVVLKSDGTVLAWGENASGACTVPAGLANVTAVSSGAWHTVALKSDGTVAAWGENNSGECTPPAGLSGVVAVAAGDLFTVAAKSDGTVVTWGAGDNNVPAGLTGVTAVAGGNMHKMALKSDGTVAAWGFCNPDYGQCSVPAGLSGVTAIAAGQWHNLALKSDGTVVAWGNDSYGQSSVPPDLTGVVVIAAGAMHSAALKADGTVVTWGSYYSGTGTVPPGLSDVVSIAAGYGHTVALKSDGTLVAWGYNGYGESTIPEGLNLGAGRVVCSPAIVDYNGSSSCIITPGTGHRVADVKVGPTGGSLTSVGPVTVYAVSNITADMSIAASFDRNTYTITASAGPNGTIVPSGALIVSEGGTGVFAITPDAGYHLADVLVDDSSVGVVSSYTFSNVTADHTISATFAINTYAISASASPNGSVSCDPALVNYGSGSACTITPDTGHHIADVMVDGVSAGLVSSYTFTNVTADHTISATFAINTYTITASAGLNGSVSCNPALVNYGAGSVCTITPHTGHHITDVMVDGVSTGLVSSYTFTNVTADHTISATFAINTYTIAASAGPNGSVSCNPALVNYGSVSACTVIPNTGHHVTDVMVDGVSAGLVSSYTFSNVTADHTISATFAINTYTVSTVTSGTGTGIITSALPGISCGMDCSEVYDYGSVVTLTAAASPDSVFTGWSSACSGTGPCTLTVGSDQAVSATFTRAVTVTSPNGGEILVRGTTYAITWTYAGDPGAVTIELLQAGAAVRVIAGNVPAGINGAGSYNWFIPKNETGSDYTIRITSVTNGSFTDLSDGAFSIIK